MHLPSFHQEIIMLYYVFIVLTINTSVHSSIYIGCFREKSPSDRLLKGDHVNFRNTLMPNKCISHCTVKDFVYAGLQNRYECFCSDERPSPKSAANESDCNMECDGNTKEMCGGDLRLSVYSTDVEGRSAKYLGCYKEPSSQSRLLPDEFKQFPKKLTPTKCIQFCKEKRYDYAGLEFGQECFCSNARPSFKSLVDVSDCNMKCAGDQNQICGASLRLSVYETSELPANFVKSNYLGCYSDNGDNRLLNGKYATFMKELSPEFCVSYCYRNGYRFAGVHNGTQCFCGDNFNEERSKLRDSDCDVKCANSRFNCGGLRKNGVYHTQISDYSEDDHLIGCFNNLDHLLSALVMKFEDKNTPKLCLNICLQLGYKFSGVQSGKECRCGNIRPNSSREVNENDCIMPCTGDHRQKCGGAWRTLLYSTTEW